MNYQEQAACDEAVRKIKKCRQEEEQGVTLSLSGLGLTVLPLEIGQLTTLTKLDLSGNQLATLPPEIGRLTALTELNLSNNQLTALPPKVRHLVTLTKLNLSGNQLRTLPPEIGRLSRLKELWLHNNPGLGLPSEVLGPTWEEARDNKSTPASLRVILAFYFGQQKRGAKPLNEVKLLLVGHGRVGKTSLSKALRRLPHDELEPETPGIERHPLPLKAAKTKITAHVWDFGGQEFLHQTHQFFFSERSIYLVVLTGRHGRMMQEAEYWLRLIRTYGKGSPVVIALNQIRAHPFTVDEHFLMDTYPEVKAVVRTDCSPRVGIKPLGRLLGKLAGGMPGVREKIQPSWARVRQRLEEMKENFVSFPRYREICCEEGMIKREEQETLATILDCLGIALNYRNDTRLRETSVLKPRWLVDGIYTVLRWMKKRETNGELRVADLREALKDRAVYPRSIHQFLLMLMEKFELCFAEDSAKDTYLVPALLDENQPRELKLFLKKEARRIQFRYDDVRPPGLLPRFIVRSHTLSESRSRWLRGVVLARGKARALVRGDHDERLTEVFALGENASERVWLTEFILAEMRVLHDKLSVRTFVESEAQPGAWTELELLREASRKGEPTRDEKTTDRGTVAVPVARTLRDVESPETNGPTRRPLPLFICYAHEDERVVKQLTPSLVVMGRRGYIEPWRDTDLVPGEDWDETIKERLSKAKVILFMVSRNFLSSTYITEQERPLAMCLKAQQTATVVVVLLEECTWYYEDFAALEMLPRKGDPVTKFNPRVKAWTLVEEGLVKVVDRMRNPFWRG